VGLYLVVLLLMHVLTDCVSGMEQLDMLEGLSVTTDDQPSVDANSTSELLVVSPPAAGSLSPNNVTLGHETEVTSVLQSTSPLPSQM